MEMISGASLQPVTCVISDQCMITFLKLSSVPTIFSGPFQHSVLLGGIRKTADLNFRVDFTLTQTIDRLID